MNRAKSILSKMNEEVTSKGLYNLLFELQRNKASWNTTMSDIQRVLDKECGVMIPTDKLSKAFKTLSRG